MRTTGNFFDEAPAESGRQVTLVRKLAVLEAQKLLNDPVRPSFFSISVNRGGTLRLGTHCADRAGC